MSFKGQHIGMVLAGCLVAGAAQAQGDQYFTAQIASSDVDGFSDNATALVATYGKKLPQVHSNFSFEGEFAMTVDDAETVDQYDFFGTTYKTTWSASYLSLAGYGVYTMPISPSFGLFGRAGLRYIDVTVELCESVSGIGSACAEGSEDDIGLAFGFGGNFAVSNNMDITAGITFIDDDVTHYSAGAKFNF